MYNHLLADMMHYLSEFQNSKVKVTIGKHGLHTFLAISRDSEQTNGPILMKFTMNYPGVHIMMHDQTDFEKVKGQGHRAHKCCLKLTFCQFSRKLFTLLCFAMNGICNKRSFIFSCSLVDLAPRSRSQGP